MYNLVCSFGVFFQTQMLWALDPFAFLSKCPYCQKSQVFIHFFSMKIWLMAFISFKELARLLLIIMILLQQKLTIHVHVLLLSYTL